MESLLAPLAPLGGLFHYVFYEPVYNALMLIYDLFHHLGAPASFGIAIIVLTLILRGALIPLTRKQLKSSREMQVLQPLLKELQAKYKNEPQRLMEEQRRLYKEHGVNPMSGCLPLVIQLPFLYALYGAFYTVLPPTSGKALTAVKQLAKINNDIYPFLPHLKIVPDLHFLWLQGAASLGTPDALHILPIVAGILTFVQLRMAMPVRKKVPGKASDPTSQATSTMQYIMPFFTVFIGWRFPAGLALYWTISTGFSAVQQYFISGGWGSLFVGIPGLEHLVPAPQDVPSPAISRAASLNRVSSSGTAAIMPQQGGFLSRMRDQMRALADAQQLGAQRRAASRDAATSANMGNNVVDADEDITDEADEAPRAPTPMARKRPKTGGGATLVRSSTPAQAENDAVDQAIRAGTDASVSPEREIARDTATPAANGSNGTRLNGASNNNGNNGNNGKANGASNGANTANAPRRTSGPKYNSNANKRSGSSGRARDTRSKGGR